jgi:hypothetical protein
LAPVGTEDGATVLFDTDQGASGAATLTAAVVESAAAQGLGGGPHVNRALRPLLAA